MGHVNQIATALSVFVAGFALLQAVGQLISRPRNPDRIVTAIIFCWVSVFMVNMGMGKTWILKNLPYLYATHVPFYFLFGPIFRSYVLGLVFRPLDAEEKRKPILRFPGYWTLIPTLIATLVYLPLYLASPNDKIRILNHFQESFYLTLYYKALVWVVYLGIFSLSYSFVRILVEIRVDHILGPGQRSPIIWHLRFLAIWTIAIMILGVPIQYMESIEYKRFAAAGFSVAFLWLYLLDFHIPMFFRKVDREIRSRRKYEKYARSKLQGLNVPDTIAALERVIVEEKLYLDEDLSLDRVAQTLGIVPHQLSELLNNILEIDFRGYLNRFRVQEAAKMLLEEPDRTILSIGYAVGFNSKSALNRNFKMVMGETPIAYRNRFKNPS